MLIQTDGRVGVKEKGSQEGPTSVLMQAHNGKDGCQIVRTGHPVGTVRRSPELERDVGQRGRPVGKTSRLLAGTKQIPHRVYVVNDDGEVKSVTDRGYRKFKGDVVTTPAKRRVGRWIASRSPSHLERCSCQPAERLDIPSGEPYHEDPFSGPGCRRWRRRSDCSCFTRARRGGSPSTTPWPLADCRPREHC
jgi:hypothetical protein